MSIAAAKTGRGAASRFFELVEEHPLRPIRSKADYNRALEVVDRLSAHDEGSLSVDEQDYLDTLTLLVEAYDREQEPVDTSGVGPVEVLKHLMDAHEMTTTQLGAIIGSKGVASEVLNGKRSLSKAHMAKLADHFGVGVNVFFPTPRKR